jgi:hypothetical protein
LILRYFKLDLLEASSIKEVMDRQICTNYDNKQSFFCKVLELIQMYDMPSIQALKNSLPIFFLIGKIMTDN